MGHGLPGWREDGCWGEVSRQPTLNKHSPRHGRSTKQARAIRTVIVWPHATAYHTRACSVTRSTIGSDVGRWNRRDHAALAFSSWRRHHSSTAQLSSQQSIKDVARQVSMHEENHLKLHGHLHTRGHWWLWARVPIATAAEKQELCRQLVWALPWHDLSSNRKCPGGWRPSVNYIP